MKTFAILSRSSRGHLFEVFAAKKLQKELRALGHHAEHLTFEREGLAPFYEKKWDYTFSFVDLLETQKPLCDVANVPHLFWERETLSTCAHYLDSSHGVLALPDRSVAKALGAHFLPTPVDLEKSERKRSFHLVLFADLIDVERKKTLWKELFSPKDVALLEEGVSRALKAPMRPIPLLLLEWLSHQEHDASLNDLIFGVEEVITAMQTLKLIESIQGEHLDVFGDHVGKNWLKRLKNSEHVSLHSKLPYSEKLEVLKESQYVLTPALPSCDGLPPYFLESIACGSTPLFSQTPYLKELLPEKVAPEKLLPTLRECVLKKHSWKESTKYLLDTIGML